MVLIKIESKVVRVNVMKTGRGREIMRALIFNFGTRRRCVVGVIPSTLYPGEESR
jgi:hypothetical protein